MYGINSPKQGSNASEGELYLVTGIQYNWLLREVSGKILARSGPCITVYPRVFDLIERPNTVYHRVPPFPDFANSESQLCSQCGFFQDLSGPILGCFAMESSTAKQGAPQVAAAPASSLANKGKGKSKAAPATGKGKGKHVAIPGPPDGKGHGKDASLAKGKKCKGALKGKTATPAKGNGKPVNPTPPSNEASETTTAFAAAVQPPKDSNQQPVDSPAKGKSKVSQQPTDSPAKGKSKVCQQQPDSPAKGKSKEGSQQPADSPTKGKSKVSQQQPVDSPTKGKSKVSQQQADSNGKGKSKVSQQQAGSNGKGKSKVSQQQPDSPAKGKSKVSQQQPDSPAKGKSKVSQQQPDSPAKGKSKPAKGKSKVSQQQPDSPAKGKKGKGTTTGVAVNTKSPRPAAEPISPASALAADGSHVTGGAGLAKLESFDSMAPPSCNSPPAIRDTSSPPSKGLQKGMLVPDGSPNTEASTPDSSDSSKSSGGSATKGSGKCKGKAAKGKVPTDKGKGTGTQGVKRAASCDSLLSREEPDSVRRRCSFGSSHSGALTYYYFHDQIAPLFDSFF